MRTCCLLLILGQGLLPLTGLAFSLTPMSAVFDPTGSGSARSFRVENETSNRVAFQVTVLTREMDPDGKETNRPVTNEFTVFPPQGSILPGKSQTVRVVWKGPPNPARELAFRLVAEELPVQFTPEKDKAQVRVVLRYMAALYVRPRNAKADLQPGALTRTDTNTYTLTITNAGTAHRPLLSPKLTLLDAQGQRLEVPSEALQPLAGENVLAGCARRFVLTLPPEFSQPSYRTELTTDE